MKRSNPIKPKTGPCVDCGKETRLIAKRCGFCYWKFRNSVRKEPILKPRKPINPISKGQRQRIAKYSLVRAEYLAKQKVCEVQIPGVCNGTVSEIHHMRGKIGDLLTDENNFIAVCRFCHKQIELHPDWAKDMGFSLSRLKTEA